MLLTVRESVCKIVEPMRRGTEDKKRNNTKKRAERNVFRTGEERV